MTKLSQFYLPVPSGTRISSEYGARLNNKKEKKFHYGIDFSVASGTEIKPAGPGKVIRKILNHIEFGNVVIVEHSEDQATLYAHLSEIKVTNGQDVNKTTILGKSGSTGRSTGPHLHFEVIEGINNILAIKSVPNPSTGIKGSVGRLNPRQFFQHYSDAEFSATVIPGRSSFGTTTGDSRNNIMFSNSNQNTLQGLEGIDTYNFISLSGNDIIDDIDGNGKIQIGNILLLGNTQPKTDINGKLIDGAWSFSNLDLYKNDNDLVIVEASSNYVDENISKITIKNYDFNSKNAPFGINLNGKFLEYGAAVGYTRQDAFIFYQPVFATKDPRESFLDFVRKERTADSVGFDFSVRTFNERAELLSINWLTNIKNIRINDREYIQQNTGGSCSVYKLENDSILFIHTIDGDHYVNNRLQGGTASAFLKTLDSNGNIIADRMIYQRSSFTGLSYQRNGKLIANVVSENGMCFGTISNGYATSYNYCGTLDAKTLVGTYNIEQYLSRKNQQQNVAILANNYRVETRIFGNPAHGKQSHLFLIQPPVYSKIKPEEIAANYQISENQDTNSNLKQAVITLEQETNLRILPNPNSYTVIRGLDDNKNSKIDILDFVSEAEIYSIDSNEYSIDDLLAGKFQPNSKPLSLARYLANNLNLEEETRILRENNYPNLVHAIWQRNLSGNNSDNLNNNDHYEYYYGFDDEEDSSSEVYKGGDYSTIMMLPNNQTIILLGVNATELVKSPQNYLSLQNFALSNAPTSQPSSQLTLQPSNQPSQVPTSQPTHHPIAGNLIAPTSQPSSQPSYHPIAGDLIMRTVQPTLKPFANPSAIPSYVPTKILFFKPKSNPSSQPSNQPSKQLTANPTSQSSNQPSCHPIVGNLIMPSNMPTLNPSSASSFRSQTIPSFKPSGSREESNSPTFSPPNSATENLRTNNPTYIPSFLVTQSFTQAETFNLNFSKSLPNQAEAKNNNASSFFQKPEGIVTVIAIFLLVAGGLTYMFRRASQKFEVKDRVEPEQGSRLYELSKQNSNIKEGSTQPRPDEHRNFII